MTSLIYRGGTVWPLTNIKRQSQQWRHQPRWHYVCFRGWSRRRSRPAKTSGLDPGCV